MQSCNFSRELGKTGLKPNVYYTLMTDRDNEISVGDILSALFEKEVSLLIKSVANNRSMSNMNHARLTRLDSATAPFT